jgi:uncharacterized protein YbjQ (UPF0145 family)
MKTLIILSLILIIGSCSHHNIDNINYAKYNAHTTSRSISSDFTDLGHVTSDNSDYIFKSCEEVAENTLAELIAKAKMMGGNGIANIMWTDKYDMKTITPTCRIRWGWFAAYVVGGLGPWVKYVEASATVVNIPDNRNISPINVFWFNNQKSNTENARIIFANLSH